MDYSDRYCAITEYRPGEFHKTRTSIFSFILKNEWFDGKIIILSSSTYLLSEKEISQLNQIYSDIELLTVDQQISYDTKKRINKKSLNRDFTSSYLYLYALRIKSKGNIFFSNSVVFNGDVTPFLTENGASFAIRGGSLPFGTGSSIIPSIYYITGNLCSDSLYMSAIKIIDNTSNIHDQNAKSMILLTALSENNIEFNRLDAINVVDSSRFPRNKYSEFIRYSKAIIAINFNTLESTDSRSYSRINGLWSSLNSSSIKHSPIKTTITKTEASNKKIDKLKEYYEANQKISRKKLEPSPIPTPGIIESDFNISVIIPAYKAELYIEECVDSIVRQTSKAKLEILIGIDNCPSTLTKLQQIKNKYKNLTIFYSDGSVGPYIMRNSLLDYAKYDNILFFDADDVMMPNLISEVLRYYDARRPIRFKYLNFNHGSEYQTGKSHPKVAHGVFFIPKETFNRIGGFQPWMCGADTEFMKRGANNGIVDIDLNDYMFYRRVHGNSLTINAKTNHRSAVRETARTYIRTNRDWTIPIVKKTVELTKITEK